MSAQLTRRRFLAGAGLGMTGAILAACQPKIVEVTKVVEKQVEKVVKETVMVAGTPQIVEKVVTAVPPTPKPKEADKGPLQVLWQGGTALLKYFETYSAERFAPKNNGTKVEVLTVPDTEYSQKLLSGIAAGAAIDIFHANPTKFFAAHVSNGLILALDELVARDNYQKHLDTFIPGAIESGRIKGKLYGIPLGAHNSSVYLFHNKTALGKKGIKLDNKGWKWSEYAEIARALSDPANKVYGSWIRLNLEGFVVGLRSVGTDIIDAAGTKSLIGSDEARPFFEMAYKLIAERAAPTPVDVSDWNPPFAAQKIMMANDNGYRESYLREMVKDFEFDSFVIPNEGKKPRGLFVTGFPCINVFSKHVDLSWEWVKGVMQVEEGVKRVRDARYVPLPIKEAMVAEGDKISPQFDFYVKEWLANPPLPYQQPANGRTTEVNDLLAKGFDAAWIGKTPLKEVIASVHDQAQKILDKPAL